jgi:nitrile hydratase subunit alpha
MLAPFGHAAMSELSLLSRVKRTSRLQPPTSDFDPTQTLAAGCVEQLRLFLRVPVAGGSMLGFSSSSPVSAALEVAMASYDSEKVAHIHEELHSHLPPEPGLRVKALESLLVEKGLLKTDAVDKWLDNLAEKIGPKNGARVIARSWVNPEFESTLRNDAMKAFKDLGLAEGGGYELKAVFNSDTVHNLVVCTLCSCYPLRLIGMSPSWYKSNEYRARAVREPRGVL